MRLIWTVTSSCTSTVCSAVYYPVKTLFLKAVKKLRCFFFVLVFCFIATHALKNTFQLQNNSKFIWLAGILFSNLIIQALPKIPKLIYLKTFKMLKSMSEMFKFSCLLLVKQYFSHLSHSFPSFDLTFQRIKNVLILHLFLKQIQPRVKCLKPGLTNRTSNPALNNTVLSQG
jgi:hypothetical protein